MSVVRIAHRQSSLCGRCRKRSRSASRTGRLCPPKLQRRSATFCGSVFKRTPAAGRRTLPTRAERSRKRNVDGTAGAAQRLVTAAIAVIAIGTSRMAADASARSPDRSEWVQLTRLPDPVSQPALSPDGKNARLCSQLVHLLCGRPDLRQRIAGWRARATDERQPARK